MENPYAENAPLMLEEAMEFGRSLKVWTFSEACKGYKAWNTHKRRKTKVPTILVTSVKFQRFATLEKPEIHMLWSHWYQISRRIPYNKSQISEFNHEMKWVTATSLVIHPSLLINRIVYLHLPSLNAGSFLPDLLSLFTVWYDCTINWLVPLRLEGCCLEVGLSAS